MTLPDPRPSARPYDRERLLRAAVRLGGTRTFDSPQAEIALLRSLEGRSLEDLRAEAGPDPIEEAQELAFQALEAPRGETAAALAQQALDLDPSNLDARTILLGVEARTPVERVARLDTLRREAELKLAGQIQGAAPSHLWGVLDARPLLRLRLEHALATERLGRPKKAASLLEEVLALDTADAQGARFQLLRLLLVTGKVANLQKLFRQFPQEDSALFAWGRVLERFVAGLRPEATRALQEARARNHHVEDVLTGKARMARLDETPAQRGSAEEAVEVVRVLGPAWNTHRDALVWLIKGGRSDQA